MSSSVGEGGEGLVAAAGLKRKEVPGEVEGEEEEELLLPEKEDGSGGEDATSSGALLKTDAHWWQKKGARDISEYKILGPIGEGAYGIVWKAKQPGTGDLVALKMIKTSDTGGGSSSATSATASSRVEVNEMGFPLTSVREIRILKLLNHRNVVQLKEVITDMQGKVKGSRPGGVYMVFEYLDADLEGILKTPQVRLSAIHVKTFMKQLLEGIQYMHKQKVMHRDIKGANLLVGSDLCLKIADFGLARTIITGKQQEFHTRTVITLWYRPPEILLRVHRYGPAIDMWSIGCIFAELMLRTPLLPGKEEREQLELIFALCGTPTAENWPGHETLPDWPNWAEKVKKEPRSRSLAKKFSQCSMANPSALDLLDKLLQLDPAKRLTASAALNHDYFYEAPLPVESANLPRLNISQCHEYEAKQRREEERRQREAERQQLAMRGRGGPARGRGRGYPGRGGSYVGPHSAVQSTESAGW